MDDQFTRYWEEEPVRLTVALQAIQPVQKPVSLPPAGPTRNRDAEQAFVNPERNSRMTVPLVPLLAHGELRIRWRAAIPDSLRPSALLLAGERTLLYGASEWQLFDMDGHVISAGPLRASDVLLDAERGSFYAADPFGLIPVRRLGDGQSVSSISLYHGSNFSRRLLGRRARLLVTLGTQIAIDAHKPPPEYSIIEVTDLGDPKNEKSWNEEGGPTVVKDIIRKTDHILAAMYGDGIAIATYDRVYLLDLELGIRKAFTGTFSPWQISLDEAGRVYMIVESDSRTALWLLTPDGERLYSFELPHNIAGVVAPPVVGHDHTVYLASGQSLLAVATDGKLEWSRTAAGSIGGLVVSGDDRLLVSEGSEVAAYSGRGERQRVYSFAGEQLITPPLLTGKGDLMVASQTGLYCVSPKR